MLKGIFYLRAKQLTKAKALLREETEVAIEEMKLIRADKVKAEMQKIFLKTIYFVFEK